MTRREGMELLTKGESLSVGEYVEFAHMLHGNKWTFKLIREEDRYAPFKYRLEGNGGSYGRHCRRYVTVEQALLHVVNLLNENSNVRNTYKTLMEWIGEKEWRV